MLRPLFLLASLILAPAPNPCETRLCSCTLPADYPVDQRVQRQLEWSERVAMGKVIRLDTLAPTPLGPMYRRATLRPIVARLRITEVWRGPVADTMTVMFRAVEQTTSCDISLEAGQTYVIFARSLKDAPLSTGFCSGTVEARSAANTLQALGPGIRP